MLHYCKTLCVWTRVSDGIVLVRAGEFVFDLLFQINITMFHDHNYSSTDAFQVTDCCSVSV